MSARYFLDTNILVYVFSADAPKKRKRANNLVREALTARRGVISYQVVQEFLNVALRKFERPFINSEARHYYLKVLKPLCVLQSSSHLFLRALSIQEETNFQWYDSLIVASALESGCAVLYSEDLQHERVIEGMAIENPF